MEILQTIGIDISKKTFDVRIYTTKNYQVFENTTKGFKSLLKWVDKNNPFPKDKTLFIFEHTGLYSYPLSVFLSEQNRKFSIVSGLEIRRSLGISRGKNDILDATRIARYGYRLREEIKASKIPTKTIQSIKQLLTLREQMVKQRAGYKTTLGEQKRVLPQKESKILFKTQERMIDALSNEINIIEKEIDRIIENNNAIKEQYNLILSIKGIGRQTALYMIVTTEIFTRFKTSRQYASYCGIAPFPYSSGTSIKGKTKVSHLANKKMKSLLSMCAINAIQSNSEMKKYFNKKVEEGKNKRVVLNAVRNKLLARIFAVVQRKTPYVDFMKYAI